MKLTKSLAISFAIFLLPLLLSPENRLFSSPLRQVRVSSSLEAGFLTFPLAAIEGTINLLTTTSHLTQVGSKFALSVVKGLPLFALELIRVLGENPYHYLANLLVLSIIFNAFVLAGLVYLSYKRTMSL